MDDSRDSPSRRKYTRHPDDRHEDTMPTDNPYRALELTQLVIDLKATQSPVLYSHLGFTRVAEALYERGVRSKLFAPFRTDQRVHFTWDSQLEGFEITETGVYDLVLQAVAPPDIEPFPTFPHVELPRGVYRLVKKAGLRPVLTQMSEVPGHVDVAPAPRRCPWCEWSFDALVDGRIPFHKRSFMADWMECQGSHEPPMVPEMADLFGAPGTIAPARGVPGSIPERKLPEGVYNVIHFVQRIQASGWKPEDRIFSFVGVPGRQLTVTLADLEAVLAEIPDVAPRYPTIWAYEQACRTIRERDERIARALVLADRVEKQLGDEIPGSLDELRTALRLRMPRIVPATEAEKSEVARALEMAEQSSPDAPIEAWVSATVTLAGEVEHLRTLGDTLAADIDQLQKPRCPRCEHLDEQHTVDGCAFTVRDVHMGLSANCPCTFDTRGILNKIDGE